MANTIIINPASGDSYATIYSGTDANSSALSTVDKGTILKVVGSTNKFYEIEYDNGLPNEPSGGSMNTGTLVGYPYVYMYKTSKKSEKIANVNNGTPIIIVDASEEIRPMIEITAQTTEGTLTGFVEAKYVYRDMTPEEGGSVVDPPDPNIDPNEPPPVQTLFDPPIERQIINRSNVKLFAAPRAGSTGTVIPSNGLKTRSGPGTDYQYIGAFNQGAVLTIQESKNGWYRVSGSSGWGNLTDVWVSASCVKRDDSDASAAVSKSDATPASTTPTTTGEDWNQYVQNYNMAGLTQNTADDEYYLKLIARQMNALGTPVRYNMDIDIQYIDEISPGGGRVMNKTVLSNPSILSIIPGKVKMFPNLIGSQKDTMFDAMVQAASGNSSLLSKVQADEPAMFSGKMYSFEANVEDYALYVNALCRASAVLLGIGEKTMPGTTAKLKDFNYTYWTVRKDYNPATANSADNDSSIFRGFWTGLLKSASRIVTAAVDDTYYINFFLNGSETSISESITTSVSDSPIAGIVNTVSSAGAMLNYFTGSGFDISGADATEALEAALGSAGDTFSGIVNLGENFLKGGRMVLPKMVDGASYGKSISVNFKFMSPYGDKYSVFLKCIIPICHLLGMALPKQLSDNMYTFPFLIRCAQLGHFNVDLGVISSLNITRGGADDTSWSADMIATEWEVQMEITPLVDELMITPTNHPVLFCKNEMLLDYLANYCGFDVLAFNASTKVDLMMTFIKNVVLDWPATIEYKITDKLYNKVNSLFRYSW